MKLYERLPDSILIGGKTYRLDLDFRNVLKMLCIMDREDLVIQARDYLALKCVMKRPPKDCREALMEVRRFLFGEGGTSEGQRVTSFDQDADMIRAAFWQEYGVNLFRDRLHWFEFAALLHNLPNGSKYVEVMGIRARPIPEATKHNRQERDALIRAKAAYALKYTEEERARSYNSSLRRVFADMIKLADRK
jgi:hypothetical protein